MPPWEFSWPPLDLAVSLRVKLGANEDEIIVNCGCLVHAEIQGDMTLGDGQGVREQETRPGGTRENVKSPRRNPKKRTAGSHID
jgi:hypothetical protein